MSRTSAAILLVGIFAASCAKAPEEVEDATGPKKVDFVGSVDPNLAGTWKTADGGSVLTMNKDGSLQIHSSFQTPKGPQSFDKSGNWLVGDGKLRLRYRESNGSDTTIAYAFKAKANSMTLSTKVPKRDTIYSRK